MTDILSEVTTGLAAADEAFKAVAPLANAITPLVPAKAAEAIAATVTDTSHVVEMTQAAVNAMAAAIPAEAVEEANSAAAPHSVVDQYLASLDSRMKALEAVIHGARPIVDVAATVASAAFPAAAPVLSRIGTLETVLEGVLSGLDSAFAGKVVVPAPGSVVSGS